MKIKKKNNSPVKIIRLNWVFFLVFLSETLNTIKKIK